MGEASGQAKMFANVRTADDVFYMCLRLRLRVFFAFDSRLCKVTRVLTHRYGEEGQSPSASSDVSRHGRVSVTRDVPPPSRAVYLMIYTVHVRAAAYFALFCSL